MKTKYLLFLLLVPAMLSGCITRMSVHERRSDGSYYDDNSVSINNLFGLDRPHHSFQDDVVWNNTYSVASTYDFPVAVGGPVYYNRPVYQNRVEFVRIGGRPGPVGWGKPPPVGWNGPGHIGPSGHLGPVGPIGPGRGGPGPGPGGRGGRGNH